MGAVLKRAQRIGKLFIEVCMRLNDDPQVPILACLSATVCGKDFDSVILLWILNGEIILNYLAGP